MLNLIEQSVSHVSQVCLIYGTFILISTVFEYVGDAVCLFQYSNQFSNSIKIFVFVVGIF